MEQRYPWYRVVADGEGLVQGDCVNDCPIIIPPVNMPQDAQGVIDVRIVTYHVIIMSQSCDLEQGKLDMVGELVDSQAKAAVYLDHPQFDHCSAGICCGVR